MKPNDPSIETTLATEYMRLCESGGPPDLVEFLREHSRTPFRQQLDVVLADQWWWWKAGEPVCVEEYCRRFPSLAADSAFRRELLAEEIGYLEALGRDVDAVQLRARFPAITDQSIDELLSTLNTHSAASLPSTMGPATELADTNRFGPSRDGSQSTIAVGHTFGGYEIIEEIARGGMGVVYKARQVKLNRVVALKMILAGQMASREDIERFYVEAEAAANLRHANIVAIYEVGEIDGRHFFSMEFVEGKSLAHLIAHEPLECRRAAEIVKTVAHCIEFAHAHGVLHRDLKPSNVLMDEENRPRVTDFGLAKRVENTSGLTMTGQVLGTPSFMPPEQAMGAGADPTSDVYSLGALLYALLTGQPPFAASGVWETISQVIHDDPMPPGSRAVGVPLDLDTICLKCLRKRPGDRYGSAAKLADDLGRYLDGEPIVARPVGQVERLWRWIRRKPIAASLVVAIVLILSVGTSALFLADRARRAQNAYEQTQQLSRLTEQFDTALESLELSESSVGGIETQIDEIATIEPGRLADLRSRLHRTLFDQVADLIRSEGLDATQVARIESAIAMLSDRDRALSEQLQDQLRNRLSRWNEVYSISYPFPPLATTFPDVKLEEREQSLILANYEDDHAILTVSPCRGSSEIEVQFHADWEKSSQLGVVINWPQDGTTPAGYAFLLRIINSRLPPSIKRSEASFAALRSTSRQAVALEIRRGSNVLQRRWMAAGDLPTGRITVRARRHHTRLTCQIGQLPELEISDLYSVSLHDEGYCGVSWPAEVPLESIRVQRLVSADEPTPLERADRFYAGGGYGEALAEYRRVVANAPASEFRQEAQFKQGLCYLAMNQDAEALTEFERLAAEVRGQWPLMAAVHSWSLYLEAKRFPDADSILEGLAVHELAEEIDTLVPVNIRERIVKWYSDRLVLSGYALIRAVDHAKELETTLAVQQLLGAEKPVILGTQQQLIEVYHVEGRDDRVRSLAEQILDETIPLHQVYLSEVSDRLIRCLIRSGEIQEAYDMLDELLFDESGDLREDRLLLLVVRARLQAAHDRWDLARADLDEVFRLAPPGSATRMHGHYFDGLVREHEGDKAAARASWATGFDLTRKSYLGYMHSAVMGSLSGALTRTDARNMVKRVSGEGFQSPVMNYIRKQLVPDELIYSVCLNMWDCPRGREHMKQDLLFAAAGRDQYEIQVKLTGLEVWRQSVLGISDRSRTLSNDQEEVLWNLSERMMEAYRQGQLPETDMLKLALTWKGQTNLLGWSTLKRSLDPQVRGPAAYMLGCRYANQHKDPKLAGTYTVEESRMFFEQAIADAAPESALQRVADAELRRLSETVGGDQ